MTDKVAAFATVDPFDGMNATAPGQAQNLVAGAWVSDTQENIEIIDPVNGELMLYMPDTQDLTPFVDGLKGCPKSGLHNPFKNVERYVELGQVCARSAELLADQSVADFFTKLTQRVMPKSWNQCAAEVTVTRAFLQNFAGDGVRFLARGFSNPGDRVGQESRGYRWPYGPVVIVAPFNFPLEIPALQLMGALFMGNRPVVKAASTVDIVIEQFVRLLIHCGLNPADVDLIHCGGRTMNRLIEEANDTVRLVQFTGSSSVAERLSSTVNGAVRIEDAGFDWKVLGPDYDPAWLDYVAWQSDEDAYNASGQKCSAQSILFVHDNWTDALLPKLKELAKRRSLGNLSIGPILSWSNTEIQAHIDACLDTPGAELLFGGKPLDDHSIPDCYGAYEATAVRVPLSTLDSEHFDLLATELFGPFQIVATYGDGELPTVLKLLEQMSHHLTAAVVSGDAVFQNKVLGATVNGTTYCGMRARTTGAPQNHWFGPAGDPRGAGIGTPEAINHTWSCHREIIMDQGAVAADWETPASI